MTRALPYVSASQALARVRSGQHVLVGSGCAEPEALVAALVARAPELRDVEVLHLLTAGAAPYADPALAASWELAARRLASRLRRPRRLRPRSRSPAARPSAA